ncbi:MAG: enoyl-CoA hydratase/isomerase family protein, partial [Halomonadaceae bacterium]
MADDASELVTVSAIENGIVEVAIARPEVRNALNEATALALNETLAAVAIDERVRCVILRGEGSAFCAGADLAEFEKASSQPASERLEKLFLPALRS